MVLLSTIISILFIFSGNNVYFSNNMRPVPYKDEKGFKIHFFLKCFNYVEIFRPRLIKLTSFNPKLLIRFIMNKPC